MKNSSFNPDAVDTRTLFRVYASCAGLVGVLLWLTGAPGIMTDLGATTEEQRAFLQLTGAMLVALGCGVAGFAEIEEPRSRHRALGCFAFAHLVALAGVVSIAVMHGGIHAGDVMPPLLVGLCVLLFYFWQTGDGYRAGESMQFTKLFGGPRPPDDHLRSAYEQRIREAASQEERHRLARDLHDSVKQQIYAMQTAAATIQARFGTDDEGARQALARLRESGREAMAEMEAMLDSLRSTPLTTPGLVEALKKQAEALQFRTGAHLALEVGALPPDEALAPGAHQAIFRVAQEAFANIGRHARAAHITVALGASEDGLVLRIEDDGTGFPAGAPPAGMGLANMRERAAAFRARLDVRSEPGQGTRVTLAVPLGIASRTDVADYRRRALVWAGVTLFNGTLVLIAWLKGARVGSIGALLAANAIIFIRAAITYGRARKLAEEAAWIESPSHL